jgi:ABC-2 type transport system permease protein
MAGFAVLLRKELKQQLRTHRLLIVAAVFLFFGLGTPLLLHYLPRLVPAEDMFNMTIPEFTSVDAVQEYLSNFGQMGLLAAILVTMGMVARERESGTAAMILSKPVGRGAFVTAKLAALTLVFTVGIALGGLGCYAYTLIIFGNPGGSNFLVANVVAGLYLLVCLAVTLMFSSFFRSQLAAGGLALVLLIIVALTAGLPVMKDYSPGALLKWANDIAAGSGTSAWGALVVSLLVIVLTLIIGWRVFRGKEL